MDIEGSVAFVSGANRGLGRHLVMQLLERGAAKVYAGVRDPDSIDIKEVMPIRLDITDSATIRAAAEVARDTTILINNAGVSTDTSLVAGDLENIRMEMEVSYFGTLAMVREFAPVIAARGGGAILNVLSVLSWLHLPDHGAYCAAKAASWAMTGVVRHELTPSGITVSALHVGYMDTEMFDYVPREHKSDPAVVAAAALNGIRLGTLEILGDELSAAVKSGLANSLT